VGGVSFSNGYSIMGGGADIWAASDSFHFVFANVTGNPASPPG
jgi:hypothetical protein